MDFLISALCSVSLFACRAAFLADLIIGIFFLFTLKLITCMYYNSIYRKSKEGKKILLDHEESLA